MQIQRPVDEQGGTTSASDTAPRAARGLSWVMVPVVAFAGLVALFAFALTSGDPSRLPSALIGKPVPSMEFPALEGLLDAGHPVPGFTSADLKGGITVVNFWAAWCAECAGEQKLLLDLKARAGVTIYGVNYKDDAVAARRFLGRYGNPFKAVGTDKAGRSAIEWGVYGMPETFVIGAKGEIAFKHVGAITPESLETRLLPAIAQAAAAPVAASAPK
jgi:cytochrome c biogenesis protein CcmG, thiol:disulfide interchange protein DsbE